MSSERGGSTPQDEKIKLLFPAVEKEFGYTADALFDAKEETSKRIFTDPESHVVVFHYEELLREYEPNIVLDNYYKKENINSGSFLVSDDRNGLPNYEALYIRQNEEMVFAGATIWEHMVYPDKDDPYSGTIKTAHTNIIFQKEGWMGTVMFHDLRFNDLGMYSDDEEEDNPFVKPKVIIPSDKFEADMMEDITRQIKLLNKKLDKKYNVSFGNPNEKFPKLMM